MAEIKAKTKIAKFPLFFGATKEKTITVGVQYLWRCTDTNLHVTRIFNNFFFFVENWRGCILMYYQRYTNFYGRHKTDYDVRRYNGLVSFEIRMELF